MSPPPASSPEPLTLLTDLYQETAPLDGRLLYAIMLGLNRHRRLRLGRAGGPTRLAALLRAVRYHPRFRAWVQEIEAPCFAREARVSVALRLAVVFGVTVEQFCQALNEAPADDLRRALGATASQPLYPQRVAELHSRLGPERVTYYQAQIRGLVVDLLALDRLTATDVEALAWVPDPDAQLLALGTGRGWGQFVAFAFNQGLLAALEAAWTGTPAPNAYPLREVLVDYLARLLTGSANLTQLGADLRNAAWGGEAGAALPISSRTLARRLAELDGPVVVTIGQRLARRVVQCQGRRRFRAAVDSTVLVVVGATYEQAGEHFVPQAGHAQRGYKLHVLFLLDERVPVVFFIEEDVAEWEPILPHEAPLADYDQVADLLALDGASLGQAAPAPAEVLARLVTAARAVLGVTHLGVVLCDRHYWRASIMAALARPDQEWVVTPARAYQNVQTAIATLPWADWHRLERNERGAETTVTFGRDPTQTAWRLVVFKRLGRVPWYDPTGQVRRDERGRMVTRWGPVYHSYLTNLSPAELSLHEVEGLYRGRWGVEHAFDELQHDYHLGRFPSTQFALVKLHIALTLLLYTLVRAFQLWLVETETVAAALDWELGTLRREYLAAPVSWLVWQRQRARHAQPQGWPRARSALIQGLLGSPTNRNYLSAT